MPEMTLEQVPQRVRDLFNRGFAAMERGNLDYAIDLLVECLQLEPRFHRARKFLRAAEVKRYRSQRVGTLARLWQTVTGLPTYLAATGLLKSGKHLQAIQTLEKVLRHDPLNLRYLRLVAEAAEAMGEPDLAIQTLVVAREHYPEDTQILEWLGQLYMKTEQPKLGKECFEKLVELKPNDAAALKALKDAMALDSMAKDGWTDAASTGGSFRRMIKDEKEAQILEQESKAVKGQHEAETLIAEYLKRIQREPGNVNYRRALADLYARSHRYEEAMRTLREAQTVLGGRDPQIDAALSSIQLRAFDHEIEQLKARGETEAAAAKSAERAAFLFRDVQERVARYPNDLQLRYEYGLLLFQQQKINEAIQQFQLAQRNPQRRVSALYHIGVCFKEKGQYDLAIEEFQKAAAELPIMDDQKKAVLYELGVVLESLGRHAEAQALYKQIYQVDIAYRDVAAKVERGYKPAPSGTTGESTPRSGANART